MHKPPETDNICKFRKLTPKSNLDAGFTLLETLVALAILSLTSLALFQSMGALLQVSDKAIKAGERTMDKSLDRVALNSLMSALVPHWNNNPAMAFRGTELTLSGLSTVNLGLETQGLTPFTLRLKPQTTSKTNTLQYVSDEISLELASDIPSSARFGYVGVDSALRKTWPPEIPLSAGFFDQKAFDTIPILPNAVYLSLPDGQIIWTIAITKYFNRPLHPDLILANDDI